jgi:hypothetical protein
MDNINSCIIINIIFEPKYKFDILLNKINEKLLKKDKKIQILQNAVLEYFFFFKKKKKKKQINKKKSNQ